MKRVSLIILSALLLALASSLQVTLADDHHLAINSTFAKNAMLISMSITGHEGFSFYVKSHCLSPEEEKHKFTLSNDKIMVEPQLKNEKILANDFDGTKYQIYIKHEMKQGLVATEEDLHFVGIEIEDPESSRRFLLPAFSQTMPFLPVENFYRCENSLVSYSISENILEVSVFSRLNTKRGWILPGKWDSRWRDTDRSFAYGRFKRSDVSPFEVRIADGMSCLVDMDKLSDKHSNVKSQQYYKFTDIWEGSAHELKSYQTRPAM